MKEKKNFPRILPNQVAQTETYFQFSKTDEQKNRGETHGFNLSTLEAGAGRYG